MATQRVYKIKICNIDNALEIQQTQFTIHWNIYILSGRYIVFYASW